MGLIGGIWLFVLGALAAPGLVLAKRPDARELMAKITPYQGWIGAVSAVWGLWGIISSVLHMGSLKHSPIYWLTVLAVAVVQAALGLLLGVGVMKTFIKNPEAQAKMDQTIVKLQPKQGKLGLVAMCLGVWMVIAGFLFKLA